MTAVTRYGPELGVASLCRALGVSRVSVWRALNPEPANLRPRPKPLRTLTQKQRQAVLDLMHEPRFVDMPPAQIWATLIDEGRYLCSVRTMYRILKSENELKERRNQRRAVYAKPELLATRQNEVWSWDITKLKGPTKWTYFYLYVILDIYSRYAVGWMVAHRESAKLAEKLIKETCLKQAINKDRLTLHADRGSSMKSKCVALLLSDLGVTKTHSRPHVSNDNPFSESQFKTLKYRPEFPNRFGSIEDARAFCQNFFNWYNFEHHHSGIALMTPHVVHHGQAALIMKGRQVALDLAYQRHPERFVNKAPKAPVLPAAVWINPPMIKQTDSYEFNDEAVRLLSNKQISQGVIAT